MTMNKLTKDEKRMLTTLVKSEGWIVLIKVANMILNGTQVELQSADASEADRFTSLAHKQKWTAFALSTFVEAMEQIKDQYDSEREEVKK